MMLAWIIRYLAVGACLFAAAHLLDIVAARLRMPRRWVWSLAIVGMCVLPIVLRDVTVRLPRWTVATTAAPVPPRASQPAPRTSAAGSDLARRDAQPTMSRAESAPNRVAHLVPDSWVLTLWIAMSLTMVALVMAAQRRLRAAQRTWDAAPPEVAHIVASRTDLRVQVWCSENIGPAAFGVVTPQIVLPAWVMALDAAPRTLLLAHEASHVSARDPLLLRAALLAVTIAPWHLPLLLAYRRLHRAVEHDCDARVVADARDTRPYATLLLDTAEQLARSSPTHTWSRATRWIPAPMPGIGLHHGDLESRVRALVPVRPTWRTTMKTIAATSVATLCLVAACAVPSPERGQVQPGASRTRFADQFATMRGEFARMRAEKDSAKRVIAAIVARDFSPAMLASGSGDEPFVWIVQDSTGRVIATDTGRAGLGLRAVNAQQPRDLHRATSATPSDRLTVDPLSVPSKFAATLGSREIGRFGWRPTPVNGRLVNIIFGIVEHTVASVRADSIAGVLAALGTPSGRPAPGTAAASTAANTTPTTTTAFVGQQGLPLNARFTYSDALSARLREAVLEFEPTVAQANSTSDPYVWILLQDDGTVLAHATGRTGLGVQTSSTGIVAAPRATASTPESDLTADGILDAKFPDFRAPGKKVGHGWLGMKFGARNVNVIYGVYASAK